MYCHGDTGPFDGGGGGGGQVERTLRPCAGGKAAGTTRFSPKRPRIKETFRPYPGFLSGRLRQKISVFLYPSSSPQSVLFPRFPLISPAPVSQPFFPFFFFVFLFFFTPVNITQNAIFRACMQFKIIMLTSIECVQRVCD